MMTIPDPDSHEGCTTSVQRLSLSAARSCPTWPLLALPWLLQSGGLFRVMPVSAEAPRRRKLAQQVPDHVLGDEDRHVLLPVVNRERVPDHLGKNARISRPGLDHLLLLLLIHRRHLLHQRRMHVRSLLS